MLFINIIGQKKKFMFRTWKKNVFQNTDAKIKHFL